MFRGSDVMDVDMKKGLSNLEVEERVSKGLVNTLSTPRTKSIKQIILFHTFTLFNLLNLSLGLLIILVGSYRNLLFLGVVFCNTIIGIVQEVKAKKIVDKLSLISAKKVKTLRDGKWEDIYFENIVVDDIVNYKVRL